MLCAVIEAGRQVADHSRILKGFQFRNVIFKDLPPIPTEQSGIGIFTQLRRQKSGMGSTWSNWQEFMLYSEQNDDDNVEHCSGLFQIQYQPESAEGDAENVKETQTMAHEYARHQAECKRSLNPEDFYEGWKSRDIRWGMTFLGKRSE